MNQKISQIIKLANEFEKLAQQVTAQSGDIQTALQKANLWDIAPEVTPLLDRAGVRDTETTNIQLVVGAGDAVSFNVVITPDNANAAGRLRALLNQVYSRKISQALAAARVNVATPITLNWLHYDQMTYSSIEGQQ